MARDAAHLLRVVQSIVGGFVVKASAQPKLPANTDNNQGWRWSVDRGTQSAGVVPTEWPGGRQAGKRRCMGQTGVKCCLFQRGACTYGDKHVTY